MHHQPLLPMLTMNLHRPAPCGRKAEALIEDFVVLLTRQDAQCHFL